MIYVPGATDVPASFSLSPSRGQHVAEMKLGGKVLFTSRERLQSEARSRLFAEAILNSLKSEQIPIHDDRPIRNIIHRAGKNFLPAVIRYSKASTKILVEVANLANTDDAENLKDPDFRERYAEALVKGIRIFYRK
jgi:N-acetylmuramoyl-L-alanine amidase